MVFNRGEEPPSPWLGHPLDPSPNPDASASFVEYLRWMRSPGYGNDKDPTRDGTKVQILRLAESRANYRTLLKERADRIKLIAGKENCFVVKCPWRIRVGGHRGPESMLLPAFDAIGMPYIPSSTLRGVARSEAIRELMTQQFCDWDEAEIQIAPFFGSIKTSEKQDRTGKVVFLDAYPIPSADSSSGGLSADIANSIWRWENDSIDYDRPKPNPFLSLHQPAFVIGIRPLHTNGGEANQEVLTKVRRWLIRGLQSGIGAQVNTGYGSLPRLRSRPARSEFLRLPFILEGQLIHGSQKFDDWTIPHGRDRWQMPGKAEAEVRPVAFKSMLRYWFRVLTLGVLSAQEVQQWEATLFGTITPRAKRGWLMVQMSNGKIDQPEARLSEVGRGDSCGKQSGTLVLAYSSETPTAQHRAMEALCKNMTWLMFHLGSVGQGARRPCYSRSNRNRAPWWRGSTLIPKTDDVFWNLPEDIRGFERLFHRRLQHFFDALSALMQRQINWQDPRSVGEVRRNRWSEVADSNCRIVVCAGEERNGKPYALSVLHGPEFRHQGEYDGNLCGRVRGGAIPSPVWIIDLDGFQVVTVFGATHDPRRQYLSDLRDRTSRQNFSQLWPV